jgi:4-hydroxy-tetrahydrodipicolinate reductase
MSGACRDIKFIKSVRTQDASSRRGPFQKKIGAGSTIDEFNKRVAKSTLKHMGLPESIAMIADGLGWQLDTITEEIEPIIAQSRITTDFVKVEPGHAAGVRQTGKGIKSGEPVILLVFEASVGAPESYDAVYIEGTPNLHVTIKGGTHGDIATATITVNCIHRVIEAPAGLISMKDLPIITPSGFKA